MCTAFHYNFHTGKHSQHIRPSTGPRSFVLYLLLSLFFLNFPQFSMGDDELEHNKVILMFCSFRNTVNKTCTLLLWQCCLLFRMFILVYLYICWLPHVKCVQIFEMKLFPSISRIRKHWSSDGLLNSIWFELCAGFCAYKTHRNLSREKKQHFFSQRKTKV